MPLTPVEVAMRSIRPVVVEIVDLSIVRASPDAVAAETEMFPEVDAAVIEVRLTCPVPTRVRFPAAERFPVGVIDVPPLMVSVPAESRAPEPE
jgi:hypothetical protein